MVPGTFSGRPVASASGVIGLISRGDTAPISDFCTLQRVLCYHYFNKEELTMFKNLIKTAIGVGALALGIKVVKDILQADA
jgi:hypothetical protein